MTDITAENSLPNPELLQTSDDARQYIDAVGEIMLRQPTSIPSISVKVDTRFDHEQRFVSVDILPPNAQDQVGFRTISTIEPKIANPYSPHSRLWAVQHRAIDPDAPAITMSPEEVGVLQQVFYRDGSGPASGYDVDGTNLPAELEVTKREFAATNVSEAVVTQREALFIDLANQQRQALGNVLHNQPELLAAIEARAKKLGTPPPERKNGMARSLGRLFGRHR